MMFPFFARKQRLRWLPVLLSGLLCGSFWMWMIMAPADVARHGLAPAAAQAGTPGFSPQTYKSGVIYGNGVYFAPYAFTVYREPDSHAESVGTFQWRHGDDGNHVTVTLPGGDRYSVSAGHPFLSFYPGMDIAMMAVVGENGQGWAEVVYDQSARKTGWVQLAPEPASRRAESAGATPSGSMDSAKPPTDTPAHFGAYQTWLEFMRLNAKTGGVYWLSGVREYNRSVRMSDADDAKMIPVTIIRDLKVKHVRGNWLLVEVLDFERNRPLGWVRWRDDEGNLMVFPNLSGRKLPIVTTAY